MRFIALLAFAALAACAGAPKVTAPHGALARPGGAEQHVQSMISYGRELILHTREHLRGYVVANMDCAACHLEAGTKARGGSFIGTAAQFPQWNKRAHRVIALQDRIAECFLYSMNGRPPAYDSPQMLAMVAYITDLSRGVPIGTAADPSVRFADIRHPQPIDPARGSVIYTQRCMRCHGADGAGTSVYPPLWGARSFNAGAGMHRVGTMASFVRYNMPKDNPGALTDQQAFDVAAFILRHQRPPFKRSRSILFPAQRAGYF